MVEASAWRIRVVQDAIACSQAPEPFPKPSSASEQIPVATVSEPLQSSSLSSTDQFSIVSNAELDQMFTFAEEGEPGYEAKRWHDGPTNSDIMTYGTMG